ncbi:MAG: MFS transporter [Thiobacillaceae bacterium]
MDISEALSRNERRATVGLATIYGLRMLGMFLILPVFALYAAHIPGGNDHFKVGLALGAYGLTQGLLQLPFGMVSDRIGRKRVIVFGLLLFAAGSFVAAGSTTIQGIIIGRVIQGAGAVSAAVAALLADLTREEHRTKAMASIGATIGLTFAVSLVLGPVLDKWIGVPGIFALTGVLAIAAIGVVMLYVPKPLLSHFHADAEANPARLKDVLKDTQLLRLNFGIFALHAAQMAMFVVIPVALADYAGLPKAHHWWVYLPVVMGSFLLAVPGIIVGEKRGKLKPVFVGAVALMLAAQLALSQSLHSFFGLVASLFAYFVAFNLLEATLPSLISKLAPASAKGTAMGVYNTAQSLGLFVGGVAGGWLAQHQGFGSVFDLCAVLMGAWLVLALGMRAPPAVKTRMFHVESLNPSRAQELRASLAALAGVVEASVLPDEGVAMLKVKQSGWDEAAAMRLLQGEG